MSKPKKLTVKILLDIVMFLVLVLLYKAKVLTLTFHEVAGLAIMGVFLIHCLLNRSWIARVTRKLFDKQTPMRTKVSYWLAVALVVCFIMIVISGVIISKVLFKNLIGDLGQSARDFWYTVHFFCSALSLILVGVHVGLYWNMVKGFFNKYVKLPKLTGKVFSYIMIAAIVAWGAYSIPTSGFSKWFLSPVVPIEHGHGDKGSHGDAAAAENGDAAATAERSYHHGETSDDATSDSASASEQTRSHGNEAENTATEKARSHGDEAEGAATEKTRSHGDEAAESPTTQTGTDASGANTQETRRHGNQEITASSVLLVISQFTSIIGLFAIITYYIDKALKRNKRSQKAEARTADEEES